MRRLERFNMLRALSITTLLLLTFGASLFARPPAVNRAVLRVSIDDMTFSPAKIEIKIGDTVEWTNNDVRDHNITAKDGSFKSDNLSSGASFKFTFKKAGKFTYGCTLHPRMSGAVVVSAG